MPDKYYQGKYIVINRDKYLGDEKAIWYRSSWELKFAKWCDYNSKVLYWGSEIIKIPYIGLDGNEHHYYPDFYVEMKNEGDKDNIKWIVEIKPKKESLQPIKPINETRKKLKNYEYELKTYYKNIKKWEAAYVYAKNKGLDFKIMTEDVLKLSLFKIL